MIFRNLSRFQNDLNLHCRIITSPGLIIKDGGNYLHLNTGIQQGSEMQVKVADAIYYGNYLEQAFDIILDRSQLHHTNYELTLLVAFGARFSPMKMCDYKIRVGPTFPGNGRDAIIAKDENRYFHETEEEKGMTDQEILNRILNS